MLPRCWRRQCQGQSADSVVCCVVLSLPCSPSRPSRVYQCPTLTLRSSSSPKSINLELFVLHSCTSHFRQATLINQKENVHEDTWNCSLCSDWRPGCPWPVPPPAPNKATLLHLAVANHFLMFGLIHTDSLNTEINQQAASESGDLFLNVEDGVFAHGEAQGSMTT